jgi:hypothetical protein
MKFLWSVIDGAIDWLNRPLAVVHFVPANHGHPADGSDEEPAQFTFWIVDEEER